MKYINKARVLLEYDKVLSQIASMARTEGAAELILKQNLQTILLL